MTAYLISLSLLILVVTVIRGIFRRTISPTAIYALWLLVAVRMVLPVSFATVEVAFPSFLRSEEPADTEITEQPPMDSETIGDWQPDSQPSITPPSQTVPTTPVTTPSQNPPTVITQAPSVTAPVEPSVTPDEPATIPSEPSVTPEDPTPVQKEPISFNWKEIADLVWFSGGIIAAAWVLLTRVSFNVKLYKDRRLYKTFRKTKVYISESAGVPCIAGFVPSIYITPEAANSESEELIILHEHTHLRHGDHIWTILRAAALVVFWWNPLVWLAVSLSRRDAELACDYSVCAKFSDEARLYYARILIDAIPKRHRYAVGLGSSPMKERILMLTRKRKNKIICLILAILLAVFAVGCSFLTFRDKPADTTPGDETTEQNPSEGTPDDPPIYEAEYLPIPEMTMTPVDALPMDDAAALYKASPIGWDPTFFVFEDGLTFYMRRYYDMDPQESCFISTVTLPEGYTDGRIVYISRGGGSGEIDFYVEAKKDGEVTYLHYYFSCLGYDPYFVTLPEQARIVPDDEVERISEQFPSDVSDSFKGYTLADYKNENPGRELIYEGYTVEYDIPSPDYADYSTFAFHLHLPQINDGSPAAEEWNKEILEKYQAYFDAYLRRTAYGVNRTFFANVVFDTVFTGDVVTIYIINTTGILHSGAGGRSYDIYHYDTAAKKFLTTDEFIAFYAEGQFAGYTVGDIVDFMNEGKFCTDEGGRPFTLDEDNIQGVIPSIFGGGKFDVVYTGYILEGGGYAERVLFSPYPTHSRMSVKNNVWADYTYLMVYSEYNTCHEREMYGKPAGYRLLISERSEEGLYDAGYYVDLLLLEDIAEKPEGYTDEYYVPIADDSYGNMYIAIDHETDMGHLNVMIPFGQPSTAQDYYRGAVQKYFSYNRVFNGNFYEVNKDIAEKVASILDDYRNGVDPNAKLPDPETEYTPYPLDTVRENPTAHEIGEILESVTIGEGRTVNLTIDIGGGWSMILPTEVGGFGDSYNSYFTGIYFAHGTPAEIDSQGPFLGYVASKDTPWIDLYTADRANYVGRIPYEIFHDWVATERDTEWWTPGWMDEYTCFYYAEFGDFIWAGVHLRDTVLGVGRKNIATSTDGGKTWTFGSTRDDYGGNHVLAMGFISDKIAFMSFDPDNEFYDPDDDGIPYAGPAISRTIDGGKTWERLLFTVPAHISNYKLKPGVPFYEREQLLYPIVLYSGGEAEDDAFLVSYDNGLTWEWGFSPDDSDATISYGEISAEYKKATNIMNIFVLSPSQLIGSFNGDVDKPVTIDGQDYYESKVFSSYDELRNSLLTVFSEEITDELLDTELIKNVDGKLYGVLADGGDSSPIRTSDEIEIINVSDTKRIVRVTVNISDGYLRGYDYATGRTIDTVYVDFTYEKIGDNWVFTDFPYIRGVYDSKLREKYAEFQFDFGKLVLPAHYDGRVILKPGEGNNLLTVAYDPQGDGRYVDDVVFKIWRISAGEDIPEKDGYSTVEALGYGGDYIYLLSYGVTTSHNVTYDSGFDNFLAECVNAISIYMPHVNGWRYFGEVELPVNISAQAAYQMWYNKEITPAILLSTYGVTWDFAEKIKTFTGIDLTGREYTWEYIPEDDRYPFKFHISTESGIKTVEAVIIKYQDSLDVKYAVDVNPYVVTTGNTATSAGVNTKTQTTYSIILSDSSNAAVSLKVPSEWQWDGTNFNDPKIQTNAYSYYKRIHVHEALPTLQEFEAVLRESDGRTYKLDSPITGKTAAGYLYTGYYGDAEEPKGEMNRRYLFHITAGGYAYTLEAWQRLNYDGENFFNDTVMPILNSFTLQNGSPHKSVLENRAVLYDTSSNKEMLLSDLLKHIGMSSKAYTTVDLDIDGKLETVLWLTRDSNEYVGFLILRGSSGTPYAYEIPYRSFIDLKKDGTFEFSSSVSDRGFGRIVFAGNTYSINKTAYSQSGISGKIYYYAYGKATEKEQFDAHTAAQSKKQSAEWVEFNTGANTYAADADHIINGFDIRKIADYPEIEAAIRASIGKGTGELTREDFLKVERLDIHESGIRDITPLKAMVNLTYLSANGNSITDLAPLHGLTKLTTLLLVNNGIADISPLVGLKNLRTLNLDGNDISHFTPLSKLTELTWLSLEGTGISDLSPLSTLVNLTDARLCSNEIVDLTPIAGWRKIERLCFSFNPVTDVTVLGELDTLIEVKMVYCPVEDLSPVSHLVVEYAEPIE